MNIGESYVDKGFVSTSLSASYAFYSFSGISNNPILSMIRLPKNVPAAYISNAKGKFSSEHTETEILIERGTTFTLKAKRIIPNKNKKHRIKEIMLLVWDS
jgi:hypothetical protein